MIGFLVIVMERLWARTCELFLDLNFQHIKKNCMFYLLIMEGVGNRANFCNLCRNGENYRENHIKNARLLSHRGQQIGFYKNLP